MIININVMPPVKPPTLRAYILMIITTSATFGGAGAGGYTVAQKLFPGAVKAGVASYSKLAVGQKPGMSLASWVLKGKGPYVASALIGAPGAFWAVGEILTRQY